MINLEIMVRIYSHKRLEFQIADRSSCMDLIKNADGSVDIKLGPNAPKGKGKNWIPTVAGKSRFQYFRFY